MKSTERSRDPKVRWMRLNNNQRCEACGQTKSSSSWIGVQDLLPISSTVEKTELHIEYTKQLRRRQAPNDSHIKGSTNEHGGGRFPMGDILFFSLIIIIIRPLLLLIINNGKKI